METTRGLRTKGQPERASKRTEFKNAIGIYFTIQQGNPVHDNNKKQIVDHSFP